MVRASFYLICVLLLVAETQAGVINGDFSQAGNNGDPFFGWSTDSPNTAPVDGGGFAVFSTIESIDPNAVIPSSQLIQSFTLDSGSLTLSFEFSLSRVASIGTIIGPTIDSFQVRLSNNAGPLFPADPTDPSQFPAFYNFDSDGAFEFYDPNFVDSPEDLGGGVRRITLHLDSLSPQNLKLDFLLVGNADGFDTTVNLDNVKITSGVIPEPNSLFVWSCFAAIAAANRRNLRRAKR